MSSPTIKSSKQRIRLWFEFYKLCLNDPTLQKNLKKSLNYYKPWGDVSNLKFDEWWATHKQLFGELRVTEIKKVSKHPNALNVSIPLNHPVSHSIRELKIMIMERQQQRFKELGIGTENFKSKNPSFGKYEFTKGAEIRGGHLNEILMMYKIWLDMDKPAINSEYILEVVRRFDARPRAKWKPWIINVNKPRLEEGNLLYDEEVLRQMRRYIRKAQQVSRNVSLGKFPGKGSG